MKASDFLHSLQERNRVLEGQARDAVKAILSNIRGNTLNLQDCPAFCLIEGFDGWIESKVYGIVSERAPVFRRGKKAN